MGGGVTAFNKVMMMYSVRLMVSKVLLNVV